MILLRYDTPDWIALIPFLCPRTPLRYELPKMRYRWSDNCLPGSTQNQEWQYNRTQDCPSKYREKWIRKRRKRTFWHPKSRSEWQHFTDRKRCRKSRKIFWKWDKFYQYSSPLRRSRQRSYRLVIWKKYLSPSSSPIKSTFPRIIPSGLRRWIDHHIANTSRVAVTTPSKR